MPTTRFILILLTYNASHLLPNWISALQGQTLQPDSVLVVDSSSMDGTADLARDTGFRVDVIAKKDFDHGGTRQRALKLVTDVDVVIFMTDDAVLADPHALERLLRCFNNERIGAAYGRQLPRQTATPLEAHARLFNYPEQGRVKSWEDRSTLGFKAAFISNSFAAYRVEALRSVGGFPEHNLVSEDTLVSAKLLKSGWLVEYCADASVYHSHHYSYADELRRYFDIGVFHARHPWILQEFGEVEGEGARFVRSEIDFLCPKYLYLLPSALLRTLIKYVGFKCGRLERHLPVTLKKRLSMWPAFWEREKTKL